MPADPETRQTLLLRRIATWDELLRLDQSDAELDDEQRQLEASRSRLRRLARDMIGVSRHSFADAPVYLALSPDRSLTLLRWRSREPHRRRIRLEIDDPAVLAWLRTQDHERRKLFLRLDRCRCILNNHFAAAAYALQRLHILRRQRQSRTAVLRQLNGR